MVIPRSLVLGQSAALRKRKRTLLFGTALSLALAVPLRLGLAVTHHGWAGPDGLAARSLPRGQYPKKDKVQNILILILISSGVQSMIVYIVYI